MKNKIFHTQDLCLRTNLRCAESCARMEILCQQKIQWKIKSQRESSGNSFYYSFPDTGGNIFPAALQYGGCGDRRAVCWKRGTILRQRFVRSDHQSGGRIFTGLSAGATVMISQHFGAKMRNSCIRHCTRHMHLQSQAVSLPE